MRNLAWLGGALVPLMVVLNCSGAQSATEVPDNTPDASNEEPSPWIGTAGLPPRASSQPPPAGSVEPGVEEYGVSKDPCAGQCTGRATPALTTALQSVAPETRACFEEQLKKNPELAGKAVIGVRVGPSGQLCSFNIKENKVTPEAEFTACLKAKYNRTFPAARGGCVDFVVPIVFKSVPPDAGTAAPDAGASDAASD